MLRCLAGYRRGRVPARADADDTHHRLPQLPRAGLLHTGKHWRTRLPHASRGRVGVAICYDRHFPEYMRALALGGADLVLVPQAGTVGEWPEGLYEAEMCVAAFQNGYYVALCNRVRRDGAMTFGGESFICTPEGTILARAAPGRGPHPGCRHGPERGRFPCARLFLQHRRPELYATWLGPARKRWPGRVVTFRGPIPSNKKKENHQRGCSNPPPFPMRWRRGREICAELATTAKRQGVFARSGARAN